MVYGGLATGHFDLVAQGGQGGGHFFAVVALDFDDLAVVALLGGATRATQGFEVFGQLVQGRRFNEKAAGDGDDLAATALAVCWLAGSTLGRLD